MILQELFVWPKVCFFSTGLQINSHITNLSCLPSFCFVQGTWRVATQNPLLTSTVSFPRAVSWIIECSNYTWDGNNILRTMVYDNLFEVLAVKRLLLHRRLHCMSLDSDLIFARLDQVNIVNAAWRNGK